ncbi:MAG: hypothetical protein WA730_00600, partial [Pseudolabrys sp.]
MSGNNPDQGGTNGHTSGANGNNRARDDNAMALPAAFRSSVKVTPGGPLFAPAVGFVGALATAEFAATVTSPFGWRISCTPAPAWTDAAPERFIDPPGMVTVLVPLDTVIVPGEVDVTVS